MSKNSSNSNMKQKTLAGYFAKTGSQSAIAQVDKSDRPPSTVNVALTQSKNDSISSKVDPSDPFLSPRCSNILTNQENNSSDCIDIDMIDGVESDPTGTTNRVKRKMVVDSDEDAPPVAFRERDAPNATSSPEVSPAPQNRIKKPRVSALISDEEDEDHNLASFGSTLSRFKKGSPPKASMNSRLSSASDDDDYAPLSDSSMMSRSQRSKSRSSGTSSDYDTLLESDGNNEFSSRKSAKGKVTKRPGPKPSAAGNGSGASSFQNFLTAAEQRALGKKDEKRSEESPYSFLQSDVIKDKDQVRPGEPGYDPRTLYIPGSAWKEFTPFEKQFWEIKQFHYDTILFFQKGKFLELYEDDARIGHTEFDLKLTQRVKMSMVGVPEMSFNFWAAKFLGKGYKVGRVDQAETALGAEMRQKASGEKSKDKIVRRELSTVFTNGTLVDPDLLTDDQAGHCISIREDVRDDVSTFGICALDCSTSQFSLSAFEDDICRTKLETLMRQLRPKEVMFTKGNLSVLTTRLLKSILSSSCLWTSLRDTEGFSYLETLTEINKLYPASDEILDDGALSSSVPQSIKEMMNSQGAIESLGNMIYYLRQLNIDAAIFSMKNYVVYDPMKGGNIMVIDGTSLSHIEVLLNNEGGEEGSLLQLLSRCSTPFGKRLFRIWLCMPLCNIQEINARLDAVETLIEHPTFETTFSKVAKGLPDLERLISRVHAGQCKNKDFMVLLNSFKRLHQGVHNLTDESSAFDSKVIYDILKLTPDLSQPLKHIESIFEKPEKETDDLIPVLGKSSEYDEVMRGIDTLEELLNTELHRLSKETGVVLEYWHSAVGSKDIYLVQVKMKDIKLVPRQWIKCAGTKAVARFNVPALQKPIQQLKEARENRAIAIKAFKGAVLREFDEDRGVWLKAVRIFAEIDCLFSLSRASISLGEPTCRPEFVDSDAAQIDFKELRHPALCLRQDFIPNDVKLGGEVSRVALLTGPNMGGKSTVMRMTATAVICAQMGMLVPARVARIAPVDAIMTRMGAYDNMFSNASTFKVELDECCKILRQASPRSLVILDELGRGTSTFDGLAIAGAVLHEIATHTLPLCIFATHYGSLTDDFAYHPNIRNMHMSTCFDEDNRDLVFLYKLIEGVAESSFGTHVAKLAGVANTVVARAEVISADFARTFNEALELKRSTSAMARLPPVALADFAYLVSLLQGNNANEVDPFRRKETLRLIKLAARSYLKR